MESLSEKSNALHINTFTVKVTIAIWLMKYRSMFTNTLIHVYGCCINWCLDFFVILINTFCIKSARNRNMIPYFSLLSSFPFSRFYFTSLATSPFGLFWNVDVNEMVIRAQEWTRNIDCSEEMRRCDFFYYVENLILIHLFFCPCACVPQQYSIQIQMISIVGENIRPNIKYQI